MPRRQIETPSNTSNTQDPHFYCKKQKKFAWAKYYNSIREQADTAIVVVNSVPGMRFDTQTRTATVDVIPTHFSAEFIEMAKQLRKEFSCPICYEMIVGDDLDITQCGHIYCKGCLLALKSQPEPQRNCAICRKKLYIAE